VFDFSTQDLIPLRRQGPGYIREKTVPILRANYQFSDRATVTAPMQDEGLDLSSSTNADELLPPLV